MNNLCTAIRGACRIYTELPNAAASTVDGSAFCARTANTIRIWPRLADGSRAAYVAMRDVCLSVTDAIDACAVRVHTQIQPNLESGMSIAYTLDADAGPPPKEIRVRVHVCGVLLVNTHVMRKTVGRRSRRVIYVLKETSARPHTPATDCITRMVYKCIVS